MQALINDSYHTISKHNLGWFEFIDEMIISYNQVVFTNIDSPDVLINTLNGDYSSIRTLSDVTVYLEVLDYLLATECALTEFYKAVASSVPINVILCNRLSHQHRLNLLRCYYPSSFCIQYIERSVSLNGLNGIHWDFIVMINGQKASELLKKEEHLELFMTNFLMRYALPPEWAIFHFNWDVDNNRLELWFQPTQNRKVCVEIAGCFDITSIIASYLDTALKKRYTIRSLLIKRNLCYCTPPSVPKYKIVKHAALGGVPKRRRASKVAHAKWQVNDSTISWCCGHNIRHFIEGVLYFDYLGFIGR
jgi:hypothetical protein